MLSLIRSGISHRTSVGGAAATLTSSSFRWMSNETEWGESIPEEYVEEGDETEGEWKGCTRSFLQPISTTSRGAGEIHLSSYYMIFDVLFFIVLYNQYITQLLEYYIQIF